MFACLAYDGIEPIDIGATFGVLSMARRIVPQLRACVISAEGGEVVMANELRLLADHALDSAPPADVLIVLGGPGWEAAARDERLLDALRTAHERGCIIASVCTGAMLLAAAGLLNGKRATTKARVLPGEASPLELLKAASPSTDVIAARIVDEGPLLSGGGVSLGIDMTLHLLAREFGPETANEVARMLEYDRARDANSVLGDIA